MGTHYGLGVGVRSVNGHRQLEHSGEVSGFTAENIVLPDDGVAVTVLTNQDAASAASQIGRRVVTALLQHAERQRRAPVGAGEEGVRRAAAKGRIDRSLFTDNANAYFTDRAVKDYAGSLAPLGTIESFTPTRCRGAAG